MEETMSGSVQLSKSQLAALDLLIAEMEDKRIPSVQVGAGSFTADILHVVQTVAPVVDAIAEGAAANVSTPPLKEAAQGLPQSVSLEQLIAARKSAATRN
jgi:hypothetical protein